MTPEERELVESYLEHLMNALRQVHTAFDQAIFEISTTVAHIRGVLANEIRDERGGE